MFNYQSFTPVDTTNSAAWFGPGPKVEFPEVYVWLGIVRSFITTPAPQLTIVLPTSGTLILQDSNSNSSLTVQAYSNYPGVVSWHGTVSYSTRVNSIPNGGIAHGPFDSYFNDTSNSGSQKTVTLPSVGGSVTSLSASLTFPGRTLPTTTSVSSVALISGIQGEIPDATITTELKRLYALLSGNTYNLMTGVAMVESAYHHYLPFTHYGQTGKWWPNESTNDYGLDCSHIGLMQPPVSMTYAFDWKANSYEGVMNRFSAALYRSVQLYNIDHTHNSNLELTPLQHEQNALCLYRLGNNEENRYWLPTADYQAYVITDKYKCTKYVEDVFTLKKN